MSRRTASASRSTLDADSFLTQARRTCPRRCSPGTIAAAPNRSSAFRNAAFYGGNLFTIPDRQLPRRRRSEIVRAHRQPTPATRMSTRCSPRRSAFTSWSTASTRIAAIRARPPTSRNSCASCCGARPALSIGIVAFSEAQQGEIESALDAARGRRRDVRRTARGRICARGRRPVLRPVREEPRKRPGRRARHHHPERLLRPRCRTAGC